MKNSNTTFRKETLKKTHPNSQEYRAALKVLIYITLSLLTMMDAYGAVSGSVGRSNSLYNLQDGSEQASLDLSLALSHKLTEKLNVSLLVEGSQDLKNDENSDLSRGQLTLKRNPQPIYGNSANLGTSINLGLPVSRTQKATSLQSSLGASLRSDINSEKLFSPKLSLGFLLSATRNFHEFETAVSGKVNTQYSSMQGIETGWAFNDRLSATISLNHFNTWSYFGTLKEFYSHNEEIGMQINSHSAIALGHSLGSPYMSVWKANGADRNFQITDDENSFVYVSFNFNY